MDSETKNYICVQSTFESSLPLAPTKLLFEVPFSTNHFLEPLVVPALFALKSCTEQQPQIAKRSVGSRAISIFRSQACICAQLVFESNLPLAPTILLFEVPFSTSHFSMSKLHLCSAYLLSAVDRQPRSPRNLTRRESSSCLTICLSVPFQACYVF